MDGFAAAYSVWKKDPSYEFVSISYGDELPDLSDCSELLMVDFSLKKEKITELLPKMKVVVIDHHKTAIENLSELRNSELLKIHDSEIYLNSEQSGAILAWNYFHGKVTDMGICYETYDPFHPPLLLRYIQDRDLWTKELPESDNVSCFLSSEIHFESTTFSQFDSLICKFEKNSSVYMIAGRNIAKYRDKVIDRIVANHTVDKFQALGRKWKVPYVNSPVFQSEIGNILAQNYPFSVVYYNDEKSGKMNFSLRSVEGGEDVSVIASSLGGGGHKHAAGFFKPVSKMR